MATTIPVLEGQFGKVTYYVSTMKAGEVIAQLVIPKHIDGWDDLKIEDRYQRDIQYSRVRDHIAPYLAKNENRFFGALVVSIYKGDDPKFTPLKDIVTDWNKPELIPFSEPANHLGFLTLKGNNILMPLDGQHRLAALKFAITGKDEKNNEIPDHIFTANPELANEDVSVIFVKFEKESSRSIFNSINRYAKPTTKAVNLITSDTDICAMIARNEAAQCVGPERIINWKAATLPDSSQFFTTLTTLYDATHYICSEISDGEISSEELPTTGTQNVMKTECLRIFKNLFKHVRIFKDATEDPTEESDSFRINLRRDEGLLLMKPMAQLILIRSYYRVSMSKQINGEILSAKEICQRINEIDWTKTNPLWENVIMSPDGQKILSGKTVINFATRFISYMIGENITSDEKDELLDDYKGLFPTNIRNEKTLPSKIIIKT